MMGDSMRPLLEEGDDVFARRSELDTIMVGDLLVVPCIYDGVRKLIVHRLVKIDSEGNFHLRGDARSVLDAPVPPEELVGKVVSYRRDGLLVDLESALGRCWNLTAKLLAGLCLGRPPERLGRIFFDLLFGVGPTRAVVVFLSACGIYAGALSNGFVWDDHILVTRNEFVSAPSNLIRLLDPQFYLEKQGVLAQSRPVFLASLLLDRLIFGAAAWGAHLSSVVLHACNALLVYRLALAFSVPGAFLAGLFFSLHPALSEAVLGISFRADPLAAFFCLLGLLLARRGPRGLVGIAACFALGLLSKPSVAVLPLLIFGAEFYWPTGLWDRRRGFWAVAVFAAVLAVWFTFFIPRFRYSGIGVDRFDVQAEMDLKGGGQSFDSGKVRYVFDPSPPMWDAIYSDRHLRARTMIGVFGDYFGLLVRGGPVIVDRAPHLVTDFIDHRFFVGLILLLVTLSGVFVLPPSTAFGLFFILIALLPVSGIAPLYNPIAERYLYLPAIGAAFVFAGLFWGNALRLGAAVALLSWYAWGTAQRVPDWKSDRTLFEATAPPDTQSPRVFYNRAKERWKAGNPVAAYEDYKVALRMHPRYAEAWLNVGTLLRASGKSVKAERAYKRAVSLSPHSPLPAFVFGKWLAERGEKKRAKALFEKAVEIYPHYEPAVLRLEAM